MLKSQIWNGGVPWYFVKIVPKYTFNFNTSSERPLSKLSENDKINVIGPTELKLWPFKDTLFKLCSNQIIIVIITTVNLCSVWVSPVTMTTRRSSAYQTGSRVRYKMSLVRIFNN